MKLTEFIDQEVASTLGQVPVAPMPAWPVFPGSAPYRPAVPPPPQNQTSYYRPMVPPPSANVAPAAAPAAVPAAAAVTSSAPAKAAITPGLRGEAVSRVQAKFNELGLGPLDVDGIYGPKSEAAARRFHEIIKVPFNGTIHADTVAGILNIPKGTALKPEALLPFLLSPSELAARTQSGSSSTSIVPDSTARPRNPLAPSSTVPGASFDLTTWVKGNWQWFLIGAIGLVTLGLFLTGPKESFAGVKEVESLDLDDLDLGNPLPPPRKKARRSKRKARR